MKLTKSVFGCFVDWRGSLGARPRHHVADGVSAEPWQVARALDRMVTKLLRARPILQT